jgi:hypothetical protein
VGLCLRSGSAKSRYHQPCRVGNNVASPLVVYGNNSAPFGALLSSGRLSRIGRGGKTNDVCDL